MFFYSIQKKLLKRIIHFPFVTNTIRIGLLRKMGLKIGDNVRIAENFFLSDRSIDKNHISIGNNVDIAAKVTFITTSGPQVSNLKNIYETKFEPIVVKDHVWIGHGSIILPGVTIGEYSIIAAGTVVNSDVPSFSTASGNPMINKKFQQILIRKLQAIELKKS